LLARAIVLALVGFGGAASTDSVAAKQSSKETAAAVNLFIALMLK
jgi:hypothetical protein